jgi:hypothetical protein
MSMALTYEESSALMMNSVFIGRVKVACLKFADYIQNESINTPGHSSRLRWAQNTYIQPDSVANGVTPPTVMDGAVQAAGVDTEGNSLITDAALQTSVETVVNKMI